MIKLTTQGEDLFYYLNMTKVWTKVRWQAGFTSLKK